MNNVIHVVHAKSQKNVFFTITITSPVDAIHHPYYILTRCNALKLNRSWWWPKAEILIKYYRIFAIEGQAWVEAKKDVDLHYNKSLFSLKMALGWKPTRLKTYNVVERSSVWRKVENKNLILHLSSYTQYLILIDYNGACGFWKRKVVSLTS